LVERLLERGRRGIDARMRGNRQEFVKARPRDRPRRCTLGKFGDPGNGRPVEWRILAMGVDQDVGVYRDQPPRLS
jgi:hypothetical protein